MADARGAPIQWMVLNILYDYQIFQAQRFGGISRYFYEIITRIARAPDTRVSVFQGLHINDCNLAQSRPDFQSFFGVRRPQIRNTGRLFSELNRLLFRPFARKSHADAYHYTYYDDPFPAFRGKRIITVHDMIHELFPAEFHRERTAECKRVAVEKADGVIAVSEATKRDLIRILCTPADKIRVIHHGNSLRLQPVGESFTQRPPYILFVGARAGYKNFDMALAALARSSRLKKDFQLLCFGGPPMASRDLNRIHELGLDGRVSHCSGSDNTLASLYKHATFFIYPSLYEGFGMPVLEAMCFGCPVLCSNTSSLPEVAGEAARFFDPRDIESVITAMEDVAYNEDKRSSLAKAGQLREAKFSWERCAVETLAYYST